MKNKHLRIITTSLLLFQNCLYPLTVFAEEAPPEVDTEFVQDLQNQGEQPVTQETGLPETATNDSTVEVEENVEENIEEIVDEAPVVDEVPIVEEQEVKEMPTEIPNEPSTEVTAPVIPFEDPVPPILRQSAVLRNNLPNLDKYRPYLIENGKKHYIDETFTKAIGREITLAATVGSKTSFTVSVPTFQKVMQENDHGWISWIASNLSTADDYPYDTMYYGNTAVGGTYELTIPSDQSVNGYQVTITKPSINLFTATFDVTITRLALTSVKEEKLTLNGNVKLGTVAVSSQYPQLPRVPIEDVSYDNALLGTITIKNEQPDPTIKSEVTVEAQREKDLSESVLKSWFSILPEDSWNYDYTLSSGPTEWAPGATGQATVTIKDKTTNNTRRFTTTYNVVDTTAPTFYTIQDAPLEARRTGSLTDEEVRSLFQKLEDNWSKPEDLQIELLDNDSGPSYIPWEITEARPGYFFVGIRLTDQAGNASLGTNSRFRIVDTTPPDGKLKESLSYEQGSETPDLRELLDGDPTDNWSLPENIKLSLTFANGKEFSELPVGEHEFTLTLTDESGNQKELTGKLSIRQPFVIKSEVTVEAQREKDLSEDVLKSWFSILPEDSEDYDYSLSSGPTEWAPGATGQATVTIKNKITNNTREFTTTYTVVDTTAPTFNIIWDAPLEARRTGSLTDEEVRSLFQELEDNWSKPEDLQIELLNNSVAPSYIPWEIAESRPGNVYVRVRVTDQAGNASLGSNYRFQIVDTTPPDGKLKESLSYEQGSETPDLRELLDGDPTDNWSLPKNIKLSLTFANGKEFSELPVGEHEFTLTLTDESGNQKELTGKLSIRQSFVIKSEVTVEAQREKDLSESVLKSWFSILPEDSGNYDYILSSGPTEWAPDTTGTATVSVTNKETNDTREFTTRYTVVDTEAPTGTLVEGVTFEARRKGNLTREDLLQLVDDLNDNWSRPDNIMIELIDKQTNEPWEIAGKIGAFEPHILLTDEAGNSKSESANITVVDTTPPEGKLKDSLVYEQGSETPDLRELLDGDPTDNWSESKDIRLELIVDNGLQFSELPVGDHGFTLTLTDEFNNEIKLKGTFVITPNKQYIDVTIPTRMSFIQETALAGIISPNYQIQNNSIRPVEVYVDSMTSLEQTERLTELTLGIQNIDRDQEVLLVSKGQNLSESVELVTLTSEQNTYEFSLFGAAGDNIQSEILDAPIRPSYLMGLHFKVQ